ncbi:HinT-interacting membrane complex lipoprotein P60 [Mycoplasma sp. 4044]
MTKTKKILFSSAALLATTSLVSAPLVACKNTETSDPSAGTILTSTATKNKVLTTLASTQLQVLYGSDVSKGLEDTSSSFYKDYKTLFDIYAFKQIESNPMFFVNLVQEFNKKSVDTSSFNPQGWQVPTDAEMKFIYDNSDKLDDNIKLNILQKMVAYNYLIKNDTLLSLSVANSKDKVLSLTDTSKMTTDEKNSFNGYDQSAKNLYLMKYLVENKLIETWEYSRNSDLSLYRNNAYVNDLASFNALANPNDLTLKTAANNPLLVGSNDNIDFSQLLGYKGVSKYSSTASGDLNFSLWELKKDQVISGFVNPTSNVVYSQDDFLFSNILLKAVKNTPVFKIRSTANTTASVNPTDIEAEGYTNSNSVDWSKTFSYDSKDYTVTFKVASVEKRSDNVYKLNISVSIPALKTRLTYDFDTELTKDSQTQSKKFNQNALPTAINFYNPTSKTIEAKYLIKLVPILTSSIVDNKVVYKWSLDVTPWKDEAKQKQIAYNILFLDKDIYKTATKYLSDLGISIDKSKTDTKIIDYLKSENLI